MKEDPLFHYNPIPIKVSINSKDKKVSNVNTINECASKCDNEDSIQCRSFNYCPDSNVCYLSQTHLVGGNGTSPMSNANIMCDHYSSSSTSGMAKIRIL